MPTAVHTTNGCSVLRLRFAPIFERSISPITEISDVTCIWLTISAVRGPIENAQACGAITNRSTCQRLSPNTRAASTWSRPIDSIEDTAITWTHAAVFAESEITAAVTGVT